MVFSFSFSIRTLNPRLFPFLNTEIDQSFAWGSKSQIWYFLLCRFITHFCLHSELWRLSFQLRWLIEKTTKNQLEVNCEDANLHIFFPLSHFRSWSTAAPPNYNLRELCCSKKKEIKKMNPISNISCVWALFRKTVPWGFKTRHFSRLNPTCFLFSDFSALWEGSEDVEGIFHFLADFLVTGNYRVVRKLKIGNSYCFDIIKSQNTFECQKLEFLILDSWFLSFPESKFMSNRNFPLHDLPRNAFCIKTSDSCQSPLL